MAGTAVATNIESFLNFVKGLIFGYTPSIYKIQILIFKLFKNKFLFDGFDIF